MYKILYLEDDINLSQTISEFLEDNCFDIVCVYNGKDALKSIEEKHFDIFIFDINLPDTSGYDLLKTIRSYNINTPTIFTTTLNDIKDLEKGYALGVDDYLRKPFLLKELLLRVKALIKRDNNDTNNILQLPSNIALSNKEKKLLDLLVKYKNQVVSIDIIAYEVWEYHENFSDGSLRIYIANLRKILGKKRIINIKKQGYKLVV